MTTLLFCLAFLVVVLSLVAAVRSFLGLYRDVIERTFDRLDAQVARSNQAVTDAMERSATLATRVVAESAKAMGESLAVALAPPPMTPEQVAAREQPAEPDDPFTTLDLSDPTDFAAELDDIMNRPSARVADSGDPSPWGIPGLGFES